MNIREAHVEKLLFEKRVLDAIGYKHDPLGCLEYLCFLCGCLSELLKSGVSWWIHMKDKSGQVSPLQRG